MEACRRLSQTARVAAIRSGWKFKNMNPLLSAYQRKGQFGSEGFVCSNMTSQAKEVPYPLTKEEVFTFLDQSLGIPSSQVYAGGKSLDFVNHVIKGIEKAIPFTNINLFTREFQDLTPEDIKHHILSQQGGTCFWINPFTKALLEQLGHTTYLITGDAIPAMDLKRPTHISTIICDVSYPGSCHLIDPGIRWNLNEAVPLDFERESPEYKVHKLRTKFFKIEDGNLVLGVPTSIQVPESQVIRDSNGKNWLIKVAYRLNDRMTWSTYVGLWQDAAKHGSPFPKQFQSFFFFTFLNDKKIDIVSLNGQIHATFYNLKDHTTERITMTKKELMNFFVEHYPQYSVKKLEEVFEVCKLV